MNNLSSDNIEAIIQKVLSKDGRTVKEIATSNNISESTIYKWLKRYRDGGTINKFVRKHKSHNLTGVCQGSCRIRLLNFTHPY